MRSTERVALFLVVALVPVLFLGSDVNVNAQEDPVQIDECHSSVDTRGQVSSSCKVDDAPIAFVPPGGNVRLLILRVPAKCASCVFQSADGSTLAEVAVENTAVERATIDNFAVKAITRTGFPREVDCCHSAIVGSRIRMRSFGTVTGQATAATDEVNLEFGGSDKPFFTEIKLVTDRCGTPLEVIRRVTIDIDVTISAQPRGGGRFTWSQDAEGTVFTELIINGATVVSDAEPVPPQSGSHFSRNDRNDLAPTDQLFENTISLSCATSAGVGAGSKTDGDAVTTGVSGNLVQQKLLKETF